MIDNSSSDDRVELRNANKSRRKGKAMVDMNHHSFQQQLRLARTDERKHIARELHDQVIQDLVGLHYQLSATCAGAEPDLAQQLTRLQEHVNGLIRKTRNLCGHMRAAPHSDAQRGADLIQAACAWIDTFTATCGFKLDIHVEGSVDDLIDPDAALCIFRVLQEALTNVYKHAQAKTVRVNIRICTDELALCVQDDGVGFCAASVIHPGHPHTHFGLLGMRERIERIDGSFEMQSALGQGTIIAAWAPCRYPLYHEHRTEEHYATV
jgi:two-component system CheB/CheR fusion protein